MSIERPEGAIAPAGLRTTSRSPVLDQFRQSPFRVLQLPVDAGAEEAVWKAEDAMALIGAGLPAADDDPLPWLPAPDEHETRQAVQWMEEPLRRLVEECFWFDFAGDPDGDELRRGLVGPDAGLLSAYLARDRDGGAIPARRNQANLRLLLAALATSDALPKELDAKTTPESVPILPWTKESGLRVAEGTVDSGRAVREARLDACRDHWTGALERWGHLLSDDKPDSEFIDHIRGSIVRLNDELVGEDDAEVLLSGARSRLIDLVVGELKRQVLEGRNDRVGVILAALGKSQFAPNQWALALRPLRHLFRAELAELDALIDNPESLAPENISIYLGRLERLARRWAEIDASGRLGLSEIADEAIRNLDTIIGNREDFGSIARVQELLAKAESVASAASVKQKVRSHAAQTASQARWACHYCETREMDPEASVVLRGQKETGRTHGFNSTTIHYGVRYELVQRCTRCADIHQYYRSMGSASRFAMIVPAVAIGFWMYATYFANMGVAPGFTIVYTAATAVILVVSGWMVQHALALRLTPKGERKFWDLKTSRPFKSLADEWYKITRDYSKDAFAIARNKQ